MLHNFVSISGVSTLNELEEIREVYREENLRFPLVIGYQVSNKSINKGSKNPRQPFSENLCQNLIPRTYKKDFIPAVHYYTKDNQTILGDLEKISQSSQVQGMLLQFNTLPLSLEVLEEVKEMGFRVIFKVAVSDKQSFERGYTIWKGFKVQDVKDGEVNPLVEQVYERKDFIDYVMFDPSHGTNLDLDLDENSLAIRFGKEISKISKLDKLGLVYAGGIKPTNVKNIVQSLISFFPRDRISIDIESGVRENNIMNLNLVKNFLVNYNET